jgi:hypothetical protein
VSAGPRYARNGPAERHIDVHGPAATKVARPYSGHPTPRLLMVQPLLCSGYRRWGRR